MAIGNYSHFEKLQMGLETFFHDADKGREKFEELRKMSNETTFGVDELTDAFTQFANVGVKVDTIKDKLMMLGNIAQGDKGKFAELVSIYSKVLSTGKVGSMRLQQLALRGVPIYDMLKKMGVQGNATAEDLTKAFVNMTSAVDETTGKVGQFYNAMDNINKTIEGKEGFISDYFKELTVNFAEVSGIADAYKKALDVLKEGIGKVSDKLLEWNSNPLIKSLLSGAIAGAITGLVTIIVSMLIPALGLVISKLVALNILSGPAGWAALAVAGITVATVAIVSYVKGTKEAVQEMENLVDASNKLNNVGIFEEQTRNVQYENALSALNKYQENLTNSNNKLADAQKKVDEIQKKMSADGGGITGYERRLKAAQAEVEKFTKDVEVNTNQLNEQKRVVSNFEKEIEKFDLSKLKEQFDEYSFTKEEKQIAKLEKSLKMVQQYENKLKELNGQKDNEGNLIDYNKSKGEIDKTIQYYKKELENVKVKIKVENLDDWQKVLKDSMGFSDKEVFQGFVDKGKTAVEEYTKKIAEKFANLKAYSDNGIINIDNLNLAEMKIEDIGKVLKAVRDSGLWKADEQTVVDLASMQTEALNEYFDQKMTAYQKELILLKDVSGALTEQQKIQKYTAQGFSEEQAIKLIGIEKEIELQQELNNTKKQELGLWEQITANISDYFTKLGVSKENADLFAKTLTSIANTEIPNSMVSSFEAIGKAWAENASVGEAMKKQFASFVQQITKSLSVTCIQAGVNLIAQSGWAGVPAALALFALGGASGIASGFMSSITDNSLSNQKEDELEKLKNLTKAYEDLEKAIKEQEEYYLKKKNELNAWSLKDYVSNVTPVNDMILTPHGNFSTHPNDTIIATKNPSSLGSGEMKVIINDYSGSYVDVQQKKNADGMNELLVTISKKIASDVAGGYNGWDGAFAMQKARVEGRRM